MITENYLNSLLKKYISTPQGKTSIKQAQKDAFNGKSPSKGLLSKTEMIAIANELREILFKRIITVIPSFDVNGIIITPPFEFSSEFYKVYINFTEDSLKRESLWNGTGRTGDGVYDIIGLYTKGYTTSDYVYGWWDGHDTPFMVRSHSLNGQPGLEANDFIAQAIREFNQKYAIKGAHAKFTSNWGGTI